MQSRTAFTLIELLLVLALLACVLSVALPTLDKRYQSRARLDRASGQLIGELQAARQRALDTAEVICFQFDNGHSEFRVFPVHSPAPQYRGSLPFAAKIHVPTASHSASSNSILFRSDGMSSDRTLEIRLQHESQRIVLERLTGHAILERSRR